MPPEKTSPKPFCFVLMPFSDEFTDVYEIGIKEACAAGGAYCERVDEQIFVESMLERIYNQIAKADFVVADMTGRNPNVFYEVGYAHALGKRTVLLTKDASDIPFDLKHFPHIVYGDKLSLLRDELTKRVQWHVANPDAEATDSRIDIDLYCGTDLLGRREFNSTFCEGKIPYIPVTIHNRSFHTFEPGAFKIGVIAPRPFARFRGDNISTTTLPDGRYLHMLPVFDTLFPNSYDSFKVSLLYAHEVDFSVGESFKITIRVFTPVGTRDVLCTADYVDERDYVSLLDR